MKKIGDKKGSHVGVVLSFVVFVTFLIFLYSVLEPSIKTDEDKKSILAYLKTALVEDLSANFTDSSIVVDEGHSYTQNCFKINKFKTGELGIIVKDAGGLVDYELQGNNIKIKHGEDKFFNIYYSEEFGTAMGSLTVCENLRINDYSIGLVKTNEYVFKSKINDFITEHVTDVEAQRERLKIPDNIEFGIEFEDQMQTRTLTTQDREPTTNIYIEEIPIQYVDEDASLKFGKLRVKIW